MNAVEVDNGESVNEAVPNLYLWYESNCAYLTKKEEIDSNAAAIINVLNIDSYEEHTFGYRRMKGKSAS